MWKARSTTSLLGKGRVRKAGAGAGKPSSDSDPRALDSHIGFHVHVCPPLELGREVLACHRERLCRLAKGGLRRSSCGKSSFLFIDSEGSPFWPKGVSSFSQVSLSMWPVEGTHWTHFVIGQVLSPGHTVDVGRVKPTWSWTPVPPQ